MREIRAQAKAGVQQSELTTAFDISRPLCNEIVRGHIWDPDAKLTTGDEMRDRMIGALDTGPVSQRRGRVHARHVLCHLKMKMWPHVAIFEAWRQPAFASSKITSVATSVGSKRASVSPSRRTVASSPSLSRLEPPPKRPLEAVSTSLSLRV